MFTDNPPGFPDNITLSRQREILWIALYGPRDALADQLMPHPTLRKMIDRLPTALQPGPVRHAFALGVDPNGKVVYKIAPTKKGPGRILWSPPDSASA